MHTDHAQSSSKHQIIFDCKGSFDQIISFFEQLKNSKRIFEIARAELNRSDDFFVLRARFNQN